MPFSSQPTIHPPEHTFDMSAPGNSKQKCVYCRLKKQRCSYSNGLWPSRCSFCRLRDLPCSKPQLVQSTGKVKKPFQEKTPTQLPLAKPLLVNLKPIYAAIRNPNTQPAATTHTFGKHESKEDVLLLSVHSILIMAIKDMNRIAVDMMQPLRRDPFLEHEEESMPILQNTIADFKAVARTVKARMLSIGNSMEFSHAQGALNDIAEPYFQEDLTWGLDQASLKETKDTIARYHEQGHTGLAYVLQIKLLRWGVELTRDELSKLLVCKQLFAEATEHLIRQGHLAFPPHFQGCQMFTPKELVLIPALANQILQDKRLDYLGRSSFHILVDAGVAIEWVEPSPDGLMRSIRFSSEYGRSTELPLAAVNKTDIFGRTALHLAVRHCSIFNVMRLAGLGANMHCMCLNSLSLLHIAACHGHDSMVLHLLEYGQQYTPVLDQLDGLKRTPFWYAARGAHFEVMKVLTSSANSVYVNIEHEDIHGHSSLAIAARNAHVEVLKWLLERRPENWIYAPGTPNNEHLLLAYAVQSKNSECVDLIKRFRTWTFGDDVFMRAMHYAAKKNDQSLRRELQGLYQYDFLPSRISNKRTKSTRVSQTAPKLGQV